MSVRFLSGINVDQNTFVVDDANNRVGINVASPQYTFHVSGDAYVTGRIYDSAQSSGTSGQVLSSTGSGTSWISPTLGTVTSVDITAGSRIVSSGGPITTSGAITVSHGVASGADVTTAQAFRLRVIADGGTFEAFNEVAIAIGSLEDIATPQDTDNSGGTVLQNIVLDEFGHILGVGAITLDTDDIVEGSSNLYYTDARARAALSAGTGISYNSTSGVITNSAPDQTVVLTAGTGISTSGTYPNFTITNSAPDQTVVLTAGTGISTSGSYPNFTITNSAPDQTVVLTGAGTTTVTGTYPNFTITSNDQYVGTVTSVGLTAGTGISVSGGPITSSGSITVTNTAPDQTVVLTAGTGITTSGTYPNFTITNAAPDQTVALTAGTGISVTGTYPNFTITNSSPSSGGTVTSINLTAGDRIDVSGGPITTSGSITVTHGVAEGADFVTAENFKARVLADGGIFEALGEVAIAIGSLDDAASPSSTDYDNGFVLQNIAVDEFGHVLGVGATDLDDRYAQVAFKNIAVSGQTTIEADAIEDTLTVAAGTGISLTTTAGSDTLTITNSDTGSSQNIFKNVAVSGQSTIVADNNNDTLTVVGGTGISITTNASTDTITITNTVSSVIPKTESKTIRATTPYTVVAPFDDVVIDSVTVGATAPNTVTSTSKMLAIVTLQVENTGSLGFVGVTLRLFNQNTSASVSNTATKWSAYMYPSSSEFGYTSFTYHIPIDDTSVTEGDPISLQLQLEVGSCDITIANFTLMSISK